VHEERVPEEMLALACARVLADESAAASADPWSGRSGWRLNTTYTRTITLKSERGAHDIDVEYGRDGYHLRHADIDAQLTINANLTSPAASVDESKARAGEGPRVRAAGNSSRLSLQFAGRTLTADVVRHHDELHIFVEGRHRALTLVDVIAHAGERDGGYTGLAAPMPGKVIAVHVARGARVVKGAALLVMEAMKMEHSIVAPADGVVDEVMFGVGDQVKEGAALVAFSTE
jgi:3-methylcrotonyl-CoA carboxylase alpha subunit